MRRTAFDEKTEQRFATDGPKEAADKPCRFCGAMTGHEFLIVHGARCARCYAHFLTAPQGWPKTPEFLGPRGWIKRLQYRRDAMSERLTPPQQDALQRVADLTAPAEADA